MEAARTRTSRSTRMTRTDFRLCVVVGSSCCVFTLMVLMISSAAAFLPLNGHDQSRQYSSNIYLSISEDTESDTLWSVEKCLSAFVTEKNIHFIDGTWFHKGSRNGRQEFNDGPRIPGSHYLDLADISCSSDLFPDENPKDLPAMFPPENLFAAMLDAMNISCSSEDDDTPTTIIVYGRQGALFLPRIWYMLHQYTSFPSTSVKLMQGSLEEWMELGGPVDDNSKIEYNLWAKDLLPKLKSAKFPINANARRQLIDFEQMKQIVNEVNSQDNNDATTVIVDTRGSSFAAKGHMPRAVHIPYKSLMRDDNPLALKSSDELFEMFQEKGITPDKQVVLSCGSGVSVCHMALALQQVNFPTEPLIYDGSWSEWGKEPDTPKEY